MMDGVIFVGTIERETDSRTVCISFDGLKRLYELKMMGKPLPEGWQEHVWQYLNRKSRNVQKKQAEFQDLRKQYMEAVAITRSLHHDGKKR
ncbi:hypothetical protein ACFL6S_32765 [Candidatus Poribacteria bacterium]